MSILNIINSGGAYLRFLPSNNTWTVNKDTIDLKTLVIDYESVKTGWGHMAEGVAPDWKWDEVLGAAGPQPSREHKRGFSAKIWTKTTGWVEWSSNGTGPTIGFDAIFEVIWNSKDENPGKLPLVEYVGSNPLRVGKGNTRQPIFELVRWVDPSTILPTSQSDDAVKPERSPFKMNPRDVMSDDFDDLPFN
jgi:hypothetical protein